MKAPAAYSYVQGRKYNSIFLQQFSLSYVIKWNVDIV